MKTVFVFLLSTGTAFTQTTLIAHKSHSGTAATFALADPGNFGLPRTRLVKIEKVNDTVVVMTKDNVMRQWNDTIYNHPVLSDPNIPVDSMKKMYPAEVKFENFDKPVIAPKPAAPVKKERRVNKKKTVSKAQKPASQKNNSFLLLWMIGGGTFTGLLLLSRRKTISQRFIMRRVLPLCLLFPVSAAAQETPADSLQAQPATDTTIVKKDSLAAIMIESPWMDVYPGEFPRYISPEYKWDIRPYVITDPGVFFVVKAPEPVPPPAPVVPVAAVPKADPPKAKVPKIARPKPKSAAAGWWIMGSVVVAASGLYAFKKRTS